MTIAEGTGRSPGDLASGGWLPPSSPSCQKSEGPNWPVQPVGGLFSGGLAGGLVHATGVENARGEHTSPITSQAAFN